MQLENKKTENKNRNKGVSFGKNKVMKRAWKLFAHNLSRLGGRSMIMWRVPYDTFKNKNYNEMKTENNVQKTGLWSATVAVSLFLISYTVSGQDFLGNFLVTSQSNKTELAMYETKKDTKTPDRDAGNKALFIFEEATEPTLEIEGWMHCDKYFDVAGTRVGAETEMELKIEGWMISEKVWDI